MHNGSEARSQLGEHHRRSVLRCHGGQQTRGLKLIAATTSGLMHNKTAKIGQFPTASNRASLLVHCAGRLKAAERSSNDVN